MWGLPAVACHLLRALNRDEEAITQYLMRIKLGGWAEERFMSALNIADLTKRHWEAGKLISAQVRSRPGCVSIPVSGGPQQRLRGVLRGCCRSSHERMV